MKPRVCETSSIRKWTAGSLWPANGSGSYPPLFGVRQRFQRAVFSEEVVRIFHANVLAKLKEIDMVGLESTEPLVKL
jgi:hypothetical protein